MTMLEGWCIYQGRKIGTRQGSVPHDHCTKNGQNINSVSRTDGLGFVLCYCHLCSSGVLTDVVKLKHLC